MISTARKLTYDEVRHFIEVESDSGCELLSKEYINNRQKMKIRCKCKNKFEVSFDSYKNKGKRQCDECSGFTNWNYEKVKEYIESQPDSDCRLLSKEYINNATNMLFECACERQFTTTFTKFKDRGKRHCTECGYSNGRYKHSYKLIDVKNFIEVESNSGCKLMSQNYINSWTDIGIECGCGNKFTTNFNEFKSGMKRQCNECGVKIKIEKKKKTNSQFISEVYNLVGNEYIFLDEYKGSEEKILCRHNICNHEWDIKPNNFLNNGRRCPQCAGSKGEQRVRQYLEDNNITFEQEYSFGDLVGVGGGVLRFDFAIFNNNLQSLVEYDGEFHYKKQYDDDGFETLQIHDNCKNEYCKDNSIPLLRIPYWEFDNIEEILDKWLNEYKLLENIV